MGLIRYDSRVDECCCLGFLSAKKALKSGSVFAEGTKILNVNHLRLCTLAKGRRQEA